MKKLFIIVLILAAFTAAGQKASKPITLTMKAGKIEVKDTTKKVKTADPVYKVIEGISVYKGAKGGLYYWRTSRTGKQYKCYLKEN